MEDREPPAKNQTKLYKQKPVTAKIQQLKEKEYRL